ncbi:hypothetical protein HY605_01355 [Candidatus Peregrinibacteria bacterium]|nr:hypothetical protein [Candidatus Peregrinibacteria bacterium]
MNLPQLEQPTGEPGKNSFLNGNKGLIVAAVLVALVLIMVLRTFLSSENAQNYEGIIKKVETETEQRAIDNTDSQA